MWILKLLFSELQRSFYERIHEMMHRQHRQQTKFEIATAWPLNFSGTGWLAEVNANLVDLLRDFGACDINNGQIAEELDPSLRSGLRELTKNLHNQHLRNPNLSRAERCFHNWCSWDSTNDDWSTLKWQNYGCKFMKWVMNKLKRKSKQS